MCKKFTPPMYVGVPETAKTLTGEKPASSVRELPPPQLIAINDGEMNEASKNLAPNPARHQQMQTPLRKRPKEKTRQLGVHLK